MPENKPAIENAASGTAPDAPAARQEFEAPAVEDLGQLQKLTQEFGGTVGLGAEDYTDLA